MHATRKPDARSPENREKSRKGRAAHVPRETLETRATELREISADLQRLAKQMEAGGYGVIRVDGGALLSRGIESLQRYILKCQIGLQEAKNASRE